MPTIRTFIALPTTPEVRARLTEVQGRLREAGVHVRWERPEQLHITMKFLGDVEEARILELGRTLRDSVRGIGPFETTYRGVGVFPDAVNPRILWAGTAPHPSIQTLFTGVESGCSTAGFARESRPFHPHVTLGRVKETDRSGSLTEALKSVTFQPISALSRELLIMKSTLRPEGSIYVIVLSIPFLS